MPGPKTLMAGLAFGESPRWHDNRLWFSDMGAHQVVAVDLDGNSEVIARVPAMPRQCRWASAGCPTGPC
jgi:sugar lactone lactonase YvrE